MTLTLGLRADKPKFADHAVVQPDRRRPRSASTPRRRSGRKHHLSPRVGFNWDIGGAGKQQLRGGIGVFAGRTPFVWISNAYGGTGIEQVSLDLLRRLPAPRRSTPIRTTSRATLGAGAAFSDVALTDPDFQFPRVLRATLGYDRELFFGVRGTRRGALLEDPAGRLLLQREQAPRPASARSTAARVTRHVSTGVGNAYLLTNTDEGEELTRTAPARQALRPATSRWPRPTRTRTPSRRSTAAPRAAPARNWQLPPHPAATSSSRSSPRSAFEIEHRFNISRARTTSRPASSATRVGLYYNVQAGRPYSLHVRNGDSNGDGSSNNDLLYIPAGPDPLPDERRTPRRTRPPVPLDTATRQTPLDKALFNSFLSPSVSTGHGPHPRPLRAHRAVDAPAGLPLRARPAGDLRHSRTMLSADVLNILNMIDNECGTSRFVLNQNYMPVTYRGIDAATGNPIYRERAAGRLDRGQPVHRRPTSLALAGTPRLRVIF